MCQNLFDNRPFVDEDLMSSYEKNWILLAGSKGYLGNYIAKELQKWPCFFRAIARNAEKLKQNEIEANEVITSELTDPASIRECCKGIDVVNSTVGITRQKDGLAYMDVDYQTNINLLEEAKKVGLRNLFMFQF